VGTGLQVDLLGTPNHITITGWHGSDARAQVESFNTADRMKPDSQPAQLVAAMATYSADNPNFDPTQATQTPTQTCRTRCRRRGTNRPGRCAELPKATGGLRCCRAWYRVIRFWNNDVLSNLEGASRAIELTLREKDPSPSRR